MIRQVSGSEVPASGAAVPASPHRRAPTHDARRDEGRRIRAAKLVDRIQGAVSTPRLGGAAEAF